MTSLSIIQIREESVANFERSAAQESRHLDYALTQYFEQIRQNVTYIAEHETTRSSLPNITNYSDSASENEIKFENMSSQEQSVYAIYLDFSRTHPELAYLYIGTSEGGYLQWPAGKLGANYDPRTRPWYKAGQATNTTPKLTEAYYWEPDDAVIISMVRTVTSDIGQITGVQGMDIELNQLTEMLMDVEVGIGGYMILSEINSGNVLADAINPGNNFKPINDIASGALNSMQIGKLQSVSMKGEDYFVFSHRIQELNWKLYSVVEKHKVLAPANQLTLKLSISAIILLAIFVALSVYASRKLSTPLQQLTLSFEQMGKSIQRGEQLVWEDKHYTVTEYQLLQNNVKVFVKTVNEYAEHMTSSSKKLSSMSDELNGRGKELNQTLHQQEGELLEASSAAGQLENAIEQVVESCRSAVALAEEKERFVQKGSEIATSSKQSVEQLAQLIDNTSQTTQDLNSATSEIESTLNTIRDIADQTNLLALNAAIESARAGEHGRGFAIVADEVRTLSKRTYKATQEISTRLDRLSEQASKTATDIDQAKVIAQSAVGMTQKTRDTFDTINKQIFELLEYNMAILSQTSEQENAVIDLEKKLIAMTELARSISEHSDRNSAYSEQLSELAKLHNS
jgi:methyl-accepting chemotaxis protein